MRGEQVIHRTLGESSSPRAHESGAYKRPPRPRLEFACRDVIVQLPIRETEFPSKAVQLLLWSYNANSWYIALLMPRGLPDFNLPK